jgi:hypothetical protein
MAWFPKLSDETCNVACPPETASLPIIDPPSSNWTLPVSPEANELMVAVKVTAWSTTEGLAELATETVVPAWATDRLVVDDELVVKVVSPL